MSGAFYAPRSEKAKAGATPAGLIRLPEMMRSQPGAAGPPCLGHSRFSGARHPWKEYESIFLQQSGDTLSWQV